MDSRKVFLLLSICMFVPVANAGVIIGGTRVIFPGDKKEASLSVDNPDSTPYLIQIWIESTDKSKAPFIITPPLYRLDGKQQNVMRIVRAGGRQPEDRESMYWVNIKSIPQAAKDKNVLQVAIKTRIKLIFRPQNIKDKNPVDVADKLQWSSQGQQLQVKNPTPFYMNFQAITANGKNIAKPAWVAPYSTKNYSLNGAPGAGKVSWKIINDYGAVSQAWSANY